MDKKGNFVSGISRSTKITLVSCFCFIALTCLILVFFVMFPITPSERIIASIGRGSAVSIEENNVPVLTDAVVSTDASAVSSDSSLKSGTTTTKSVKIVITTGSGFLWNGRGPSGVSSDSDYTTTAVDPDVPTYDPGYVPPVIPNNWTWTDPNAGGNWNYPGYGNNWWSDPNAGGTWTDPNAGGSGNVPSGGDVPSVDVPPVVVPDNGNVGGDTGSGNDVSVW